MSRTARGIVVLALAVPSLALSATPCAACSCEARSAAEIVEDAEAVFIGEVTGDRLVDEGTAQRFTVDRVYAGVVPPELELYSPIGPSFVNTCGVLYSPGTKVAVAMSYDEEGRPTTGVCSFLTPAQVRDLGVQGVAPDPNAVVPTIDPIVPPGPGPGLGAVPLWAIVALGVAGAAGLAAFATIAGRRRENREALSPLPADDEVPAPTDASGDPPG